MTGTKTKVRGLFLAALMITSVFAGVVAFSGSVAASAGNVSATNSPVAAGDDVSFDVDDDAGGGNDIHVWIDQNTDGVYNASEPSTTVSGDDGNTVSGSLTVPSGAAAGTYTLSAAENGSLTVGTSQDVSTTFDVDSTGPSIESTAELQSSSLGSNDKSVIEVAFSENLDSAVSPTVYVDGDDVTSDYTVDSDGTTGTLVLSSTTALNPTNELIVDLGTISDGANEVTVGEIEIAPTSYSLEEGNGAKSYYQGGTLAYVTNEFDEGLEVKRGSSVIFSGSTGTNSKVFKFKTADRDTSANWNFSTSGTSSTTDKFNLRELTQDVSTSNSITDAQDLTVSIEQNRGGAGVLAVLYDSNDEVVDSRMATLSGSGERTVNFGAQAVDNYTVSVTDVQTGVTGTTDTIEVTKAAAGEVDLASSLTRDQLGDISSITLELDATSDGVVHVGSDDAGYEANVTVDDVDGDGEVVLQVNTFTMGQGQPAVTYTAAGDDEVTDVSDETSLTSLIDTGSYNLEVASGTSYDVEAQNVGTLDITTRSTNALNVWTAPGAVDLSDADATDVADAVEAGTITESDSIAAGDYVIHELDAEGLSGVIANDSSGFFGVVANNSDVSLKVQQDSPQQNRKAKQLVLNESNTAVIAGDDVYYLVTSSSDVAAQRVGTNTYVPVTPSDGSYTANFSVAEGALATADQSVEDSFAVTQRTIEIDVNDDDVVRVESDSNQTITGTSSLAPGSQLNFRLPGTEEGVSFLKQGSAKVQADGTWSFQVNFSDVSADSTFKVNARDRGTQRASVDGIVGEAAAPASFEVSDLSAPGTVTVGDEVTATATVANNGGTEGTTTVEFTFGGDVVDSQEVTLAPGESTTVEFSIAADVDAGTYTHGISAGDSSQTAEITVEAESTPTPTPTETATPTPTETATPTPTATATQTDAPTDTPTDTESDDGGQPGFGIGVALVALMGAALLALRRQN